jgi:hypothetical protein
MNFATKNLKLGVSPLHPVQQSQPVLIPDGASRLTIQFFHTLFSINSTACRIKVLQSTDGVHFDPLCDASGNQLELTLESAGKSATLNILGILSVWISFHISLDEEAMGILEHCNILFA